jgi:hypothetical protein
MGPQLIRNGLSLRVNDVLLLRAWRVGSALPIIVRADRGESKNRQERQLRHQRSLSMATHPHQKRVVLLYCHFLLSRCRPRIAKRHYPVTDSRQ